MTALVLGALALTCLLGGVIALRSVGPGYRIARLLSGTRQLELGEALALAASERGRYVRVHGRISSDEEFPDEHDRPLVYRRSRLEISDGEGRWSSVAEDSEAVPFGVESRGQFLAIDASALVDGLVVVPREALGSVRDLEPELAGDHPPDAPSRLVIEQVSAVEQATVVGILTMTADGTPLISSAAGKPLLLTTLDLPAAMRLLARGRRRLVVGAAVLLAFGLGFAAAALLALTASV